MSELPTLAERVASCAQAPVRPGPPLLRFVKIAADGSYVVRSRSYAELWANAQAIAKAMRRAGLRNGDRAGLPSGRGQKMAV